MKRSSLTRSILKQHCPRCRSEKMFINPIYSLGFDKMHKKCPNCSQELEPEPGFYTGAMYVSYGLQVVIIASIFLMSKLLEIEGNTVWYISWIAGVIVILFSMIFRLSRAIWAHLLIPSNGSSLIEKKELLKTDLD